MKRFIQIYIIINKSTTKDKLEEKLSLALDWYRYDPNLYILHTTSDVDKWQERLFDFVKNDGKLFICELQIENRNGWMNKDFWNWLNPKSVERNEKIVEENIVG